ncbi:MAG: hypothetical protein Q8Q09_07635 [Deltaproteobacteria bacterium]|nr:hypothetical protein [Deltaproteobacteria bacterium]
MTEDGVSKAPDDRAMVTKRGWIPAIREWFLLQRAQDLQAGWSETERVAVAARVETLDAQWRAVQTLYLSRQHAAALTLWSSLQSTFTELAASLPALAPIATVATGEAPVTKRELGAALSALRPQIAALRVVALPAKSLARLRVSRVGSALLAAVMVLGLLTQGLRPDRLRVTVFTSLSPEFAGEFAVDRDPRTQWLGPDHLPGWLQINFARRRVHVLRLLNVQGRSDRGTGRVRMDLFVDGRVVHTEHADLQPMVANPQPMRIPMLYTQPIDGIRISIETFVGLGAGLAEVEID